MFGMEKKMMRLLILQNKTNGKNRRNRIKLSVFFSVVVVVVFGDDEEKEKGGSEMVDDSEQKQYTAV